MKLLEKFAVDARSGRIPEDRLRFGAPWRHPPRIDNPTLCSEWTKLQLIDFVQSLVNAEFGVTLSSWHVFYYFFFSLSFAGIVVVVVLEELSESCNMCISFIRLWSINKKFLSDCYLSCVCICFTAQLARNHIITFSSPSPHNLFIVTLHEWSKLFGG